MAKTKKQPSKNNKSTPILQFSVLCDAVGKDPSGKFVFSGVFNGLKKPNIVPQFFIVNRYIYGEGEFKEKIRIKSPDLKKTVVEIEEHKFTLQSEISAFDAVMGFVNVNFEEAGIYWVEVLLDNELVLSYPLPVGSES
jgi:hypothetical protein